MNHKKIVVLSMDEEYVKKMEFQMAEAFGVNTELVFLTDEKYIEEYMGEMQNITIMIVDEPLMTVNVKKQNPEQLFFLTDNENRQNMSQSGTKWIYKYASFRSMLEQIDPSLLYRNQRNQTEITKVVSVYSPIGGSGTTVTALGIADALYREGNKVLYYNTATIQDFPYYLEEEECLEDTMVFQLKSNLYGGVDQILAEVKKKGFEYVPAFRKTFYACQMTMEMHRQVIECIQKKNIYDYIIVEFSQEIQMEKLRILCSSERVVIVSGQSEHDVKRLEMFWGCSKEPDGECVLVCNRYEASDKDYLAESAIGKKYLIAEYVDKHPDELTLERIGEEGLFHKVACVIS